MKNVEAVNLYTEPKLNNPSLVAVWPGMGSVAIMAGRYLKDKLGAEEFGEISPYDFFEPGMVPIQNNILKEPEFPRSKLYFWKGRKGKELIIFIGDAQPLLKSYKMANLVSDIAQNFTAKRIYTFAAAPSHIYYTRKPRISGVVTAPELVTITEEQGIKLMRQGSISGMNGLLLGVAKKRNIEGICLLGEIPIYMAEMPAPRASKVVLEALTRILGIEIDMAELDSWIEKADEEIEKNIYQLMISHGEEARRLIDYFERLKEQATAEELGEDLGTAETPGYNTEELLKEVEQFLKKERDKEDNN